MSTLFLSFFLLAVCFLSPSFFIFFLSPLFLTSFLFFCTFSFLDESLRCLHVCIHNVPFLRFRPRPPPFASQGPPRHDRFVYVLALSSSGVALLGYDRSLAIYPPCRCRRFYRLLCCHHVSIRALSLSLSRPFLLLSFVIIWLDMRVRECVVTVWEQHR